MKVSETQITKVLITDALPNLDPVTVLLEEMPIYRGKMIVECYGQSWSAYWGNMGCTLRQFIQQASVDYLAGCLARPELRRDIYSPEAMEANLKREVLRLRRAQELSKSEAYDMMYEIETMDLERPFYVQSNLLNVLLGDDWQCALPEKRNPEFEYIERVVTAVKAGLAVPKEELQQA